MNDTRYKADEIDSALQTDGEFHTPLERVNYEAGMLLGVEATRAEQDYHRRRLNRHQYWLHGSGTIVGLAVKMAATENDGLSGNRSVQLLISPGVGIDGLGREVLCHEPYCIDLGEWLLTQWDSADEPDLLADGMSDDGKHLLLTITMRYASCPGGMQPVLARKVNAGTDAVQASREKDSVMFEIIAGAAPAVDGAWPWHGIRPNAIEEEHLSLAEQALVNSLSGRKKQAAEFAGQLIYALPANNQALNLQHDSEQIARTVLAEIQVPLGPDNRPGIQAEHIQVNNLIRPMLSSADQQAWLRRND